MKVLAIDYGAKRVGLAIGDSETNLALPHGVLADMNDDELVNRLKEIIIEEEIDIIIVGEPVTLAGYASEQTQKSREFAQLLEKYLTVPVKLFDERLTSRRADAATLGATMPTRNRDELAAMFLLQDYLDKQKSNNF
ncbi:MAG: hypothetical protein UV57_C0021G0025 [Parcubacteria group bacterium GW2011_GWD2_43_10]|uniref:Putative pre-16S rRNA nuclease n=3 Tax=Candidatus Vebleniibacteriota TaxID=1817921 RepID=A0A1G2Q220_9BACT|nr:MAG: hypothetical protein UV57_C0021G0025 [Parcubacteria group bacterium GW2011_GWD2_43_10]OHA54079.1 MAG: hypothetical protein A2226_02090 [Candidatus Veblenbacteria bacterium RIFOXYA2_FULL_43_9]OHA54578.1 MAG: hypothetical protein A2388_03530 [Candidatus Veblenbacteria bacterium RIFOXYB1_FULL_43_13]OHA57437.1 MAG: hypothetical protein A2441_02640 [Candidatus Veblenbacteria bacterium RIFOXYC2_FULL_42_11]HAO81294.1 Holliday junction resolvase RuvX [Candidatus Veblenbacteria bacterium]